MGKNYQQIIHATLCGVVCCLVMVACNTTSDPVSPASTLQFSATIGAAPDCPTFNEACRDISALVAVRCPASRDYRNYGQENSCVRRLIGRELDDLKDCFSSEELAEMRACIRFALSPAYNPERFVVPKRGE